MKIEILRKSKKSKWRWRAKANNGEIWIHSECYESKQMAEKSVRRFLVEIKSAKITVIE